MEEIQSRSSGFDDVANQNSNEPTNESGNGSTPTIEKESLENIYVSQNKKVPVKKKKAQAVQTGRNRSTSDIWEHFVRIDGSDPPRAKCNYCDATYAAHPKNNGTSSLWSHLETRCQKYPFRLEKKQKTFAEYCVKEQNGTSLMVGSKPKALDVEACRDGLALMIFIDELPFRMVEGDGFRQFCKILEPRFIVPSRTTVAADCVRLYEKEKNKMKKLLKNQRLSLTTDCWTSIQNLSYLTLTAHFLDDNWKMQKRILNFCSIESHKGETIRRTIESCLVDWGFDKIFTITVDNASSNNKAIEYLQLCNWRDEVLYNKYLHVRCSAHIINLIVREGLKEQINSVQRIRNAMKFVRSSPSRSKKFQDCVVFEKIDCKKGVCLDVETRWNSTYLMLETAIKYKKAFNRMSREESTYLTYFDGGYGDEIDNDYEFEVVLRKRGNALIGPPEKMDWVKAEAFVKFLKLFYDATLALSGSNFVTSAIFFRQIVLIHWSIKKMQSSSDLVMKHMADNMREKFEKYWVDSNLRNDLLFLGVVFDPRYKFKHVEFCFEQIYAENEGGSKRISEKGVKLIEDVRFLLERLVKSYMERYASKERIDTDGGFSIVSHINDEFESSDGVDALKYLDSQFKMKLEQEESVETKCELTRYLHEACEKDASLDILEWWKMNASKYPVLSKVAKEVLAIQVSTVASEQSFSTGGRILNEFRSSLKPKTVEMLVCGQNWFRFNNDPIDLRKILEDIEKYEDIATESSTSISVGNN